MKFRFALIFVAATALCAGAQAQSTPATPSPAASDAKRELATKLVALQRGPEMERMIFQLTSSAVQPEIAKWGPKLENMPKAAQEKAREQLNTELKALGDNARKVITAQMDKSSQTTLVPAYLERFSEDEMKQLLAMFEAPAFKKYQAAAPDLGNAWVKDVVDSTRNEVLEMAKSFDVTATKIIGEKAADKAAEKPADKTAPKKK